MIVFTFEIWSQQVQNVLSCKCAVIILGNCQLNSIILILRIALTISFNMAYESHSSDFLETVYICNSLFRQSDAIYHSAKSSWTPSHLCPSKFNSFLQRFDVVNSCKISATEIPVKFYLYVFIWRHSERYGMIFRLGWMSSQKMTYIIQNLFDAGKQFLRTTYGNELPPLNYPCISWRVLLNNTLVIIIRFFSSLPWISQSIKNLLLCTSSHLFLKELQGAKSSWIFIHFLQVGYDKLGLPIGLQLIGRPWGEATILRMAAAVEVSICTFT